MATAWVTLVPGEVDIPDHRPEPKVGHHARWRFELKGKRYRWVAEYSPYAELASFSVPFHKPRKYDMPAPDPKMEWQLAQDRENPILRAKMERDGCKYMKAEDVWDQWVDYAERNGMDPRPRD